MTLPVNITLGNIVPEAFVRAGHVADACSSYIFERNKNSHPVVEVGYALSPADNSACELNVRFIPNKKHPRWVGDALYMLFNHMTPEKTRKDWERALVIGRLANALGNDSLITVHEKHVPGEFVIACSGNFMDDAYHTTLHLHATRKTVVTLRVSVTCLKTGRVGSMMIRGGGEDGQFDAWHEGNTELPLLVLEDMLIVPGAQVASRSSNLLGSG